MRSPLVASAVAFAAAACVGPPPSPAAPSPVPASSDGRAAGTTEVTSERLPRPSVPLAELFLRAEEVAPGMRVAQEPLDAEQRYEGIVACLGGRAGRASGMAMWNDPDGREPLWRLNDLRWVFEEDSEAQRFVETLRTHFVAKHFTTHVCDAPAVGDACLRIAYDDRLLDGTPSRQYGVVFRIGRVVAEVVATQGPRAVSPNALTPEMVRPFVERAERRIRAATEASPISAPASR